MRKYFFASLFVYINLLVLGSVEPISAQKESLPLVAETQYFSVYAYPGMSTSNLLQRMNFDYFLNTDALLSKSPGGQKDVLTKTFDALYSEVSDILGIHSRNFHTKILIFQNHDEMSLALSAFFGTKFKEASFYFHDENTIYLDDQTLTLGLLGHEIGHAIVSHYFGVPPPAKVQEVLCGYVEYNLRKSTGSLPSSSRPMGVRIEQN